MRKYCKALLNLFLSLTTMLLVLFVVPKILVFFAPFVIGWIVASLAAPLVHFFEKKMKIKRKAGSIVVMVLALGLVMGLIYLLGHKLVVEGIGLMNELPSIWRSLENDFYDISRRLSLVYEKLPMDLQLKLTDAGNEIIDFFRNLVGNISMPTILAVGNFAKQLPSIVIGIIMTVLSAYLFLADHNQIRNKIRAWLPVSIQGPIDIIKRSLAKALGGYLRAQFYIEVWMYLLLVIGLGILQVRYAILIALLIAILDFIPFFGTGTVLVPWAVLELLSADYWMAVGLLLIWGIGQLARQLIQPKIVGDTVGIAPIPTLFLLYAGYRIGGVWGMILSVPIGLVLYTMYKEGAFDTTQNSIRLLIYGINHFRKFEEDELKCLDKNKNL